jgi:Nitroreductase family
MVTTHHDALAAAAREALRAPSLFNSQPWSWSVDEDSLELRVDHDRRLPVIDAQGRFALLSCGVTLHHARISLVAAGYTPSVQRWVRGFDDDLLARVTVTHGGEVAELDRALYDAIAVRRTDRRPFSDEPVPQEAVARLCAAAQEQGAELAVVRDDQLPELATAVTRAQAAQEADPAYRNELMRWTNRPPWSGDGVPVETAVADVERPVPVRKFAIEPHTGLTVAPGGDRGATFLILHGPTDTAADWFAAGEATSAVILTATALGLAVAPISDVIEVDSTRELIRGLLPAGRYPYLVLRCGIVADESELAGTPRRPAHEALREQPGWRF